MWFQYFLCDPNGYFCLSICVCFWMCVCALYTNATAYDVMVARCSADGVGKGWSTSCVCERKGVQSIYLHNKPEQCPFDLNTTHNTHRLKSTLKRLAILPKNLHNSGSESMSPGIISLRDFYMWSENVSEGVNSGMLECILVAGFSSLSLFGFVFIHSCKHQRKLYCDIFLPVFGRFSRTVFFFLSLSSPFAVYKYDCRYFFFRSCSSAMLFIGDDDDDDGGVAALNASATRDVVPNQLLTNWASIYATLKFACRKW